jgi:hypothetical protein
MAISTKELNKLKRFRAKEDFNLQLYKFINEFKSKEEPTITLTDKDKLEGLARFLYKCIPDIKN